MIAREYLISGKVQGVGFRAHTQAEAIALGITGSAMNLADGRVRVQAYGDAEALASLARWLEHGPRLAEVLHITVTELDPAGAPQRFLMG
jgi:acylphosphatase